MNATPFAGMGLGREDPVGPYDECIIELGARVDTIRGRMAPSAPSAPSVRETFHPQESLLDGLPVAVGPGANPGVILRSDTFVELGNPAEGSCAAVLWTTDPGLVVDGRIRLLGPDIPEAQGASLPFAQMVIVAGPSLGPDEHEILMGIQNLSDTVEGFMAKSTSEYVWARVSGASAAKGLDLDTLGRVLLQRVKASVPGATSAEVVFVTSSRDDVRSLSDLAATARQIGSDILRQTWKDRGFDLECDFDCSSCTDQEVCDDIREVIVATARVAVAKKQERTKKKDRTWRERIFNA